MVVLNVALLSLLLPAAVLARPNQHERLHHKRGHFDAIHPSGIHGGPPSHPHPTAGPTAPFPVGNVTVGGPSTVSGSVTSSSGGNSPVTISSIITVIPVPFSSGQTAPNSPESGSPAGSSGSSPGSPSGSPEGSGGSGTPASPSGSPEGPGGSGSPGSSEACGPATVTVTKANTVTVTVPAAGSPSSSSTPVKEDSEGVPYVDSHQSPASSPSPKPIEHKSEAKEKAVEQPAAKPKAEENPAAKPKAEEKPAAKAEEKPAAKPNTEEKAAAKPKVEAVPAVKPKVDEKHAVAPKVEVKPAVKPEVSESQPKTSPVVAQKFEQPKAPAKKPAESPKPSKPSSGGGKGILYSSLAEANAMSGMKWGCNWDSSPWPQSGWAKGSLNFEFVPQLWGPQDGHTTLWEKNSKDPKYKYVMAFNEPNIGLDGGGCGPMLAKDAIPAYEEYLGPNRVAKQKIVSPCVSNNVPEWLDEFIEHTKLKPDAVCFHWYGETTEGLKEVVKQFTAIQEKHHIPELWLSEFAFNIDVSSEEAKAAFELLESSAVDRWAYNDQKFVNTPTVKSVYMS